MSAFSDPTFDFKSYFDNRPKYPEFLYETILDYHGKENRNVILDLGAGPGLSLFPFAKNFKHLIATDVSEGMINQAKETWKIWKEMQTEPLEVIDTKFLIASAENLKGIEDSSVDVIIAATAAHWFNYSQIWPELSRVLKSKGTIAFWTYGNNYLPRHSEFSAEKHAFPEFLEPYWQQPGRSILVNLYRDIPFPNELENVNKEEIEKIWNIESSKRIYHKMISKGILDLSWTIGKSKEEKFRIEKVMSFDGINNYIRTCSATLKYFQKFPEKNKRPDDVDEFIKNLQKKCLLERSKGIALDDGLDENHVTVAWPLGLMMIKKC